MNNNKNYLWFIKIKININFTNDLCYIKNKKSILIIQMIYVIKK